ncbi:MAG: nuclear transport factor 2 family protein [Burkholderiaceae bacterium]
MLLIIFFMRFMKEAGDFLDSLLLGETDVVGIASFVAMMIFLAFIPYTIAIRKLWPMVRYMDKMSSLMADDMVWHNEGDKTLPWIRGDIAGKAAIFDFLPVFSSNLKTTKWENTDAFASGNTVAVFGAMAATATKTGHSTGDFSFALRAKVRDGQLILWHWFEDSFAVSQAYQRNK